MAPPEGGYHAPPQGDQRSQTPVTFTSPGRRRLEGLHLHGDAQGLVFEPPGGQGTPHELPPCADPTVPALEAEVEIGRIPEQELGAPPRPAPFEAQTKGDGRRQVEDHGPDLQAPCAPGNLGHLGDETFPGAARVEGEGPPELGGGLLDEGEPLHGALPSRPPSAEGRIRVGPLEDESRRGRRAPVAFLTELTETGVEIDGPDPPRRRHGLQNALHAEEGLPQQEARHPVAVFQDEEVAPGPELHLHGEGLVFEAERNPGGETGEATVDLEGAKTTPVDLAEPSRLLAKALLRHPRNAPTPAERNHVPTQIVEEVLQLRRPSLPPSHEGVHGGTETPENVATARQVLRHDGTEGTSLGEDPFEEGAPQAISLHGQAQAVTGAHEGLRPVALDDEPSTAPAVPHPRDPTGATPIHDETSSPGRLELPGPAQDLHGSGRRRSRGRRGRAQPPRHGEPEKGDDEHEGKEKKEAAARRTGRTSGAGRRGGRGIAGAPNSLVEASTESAPELLGAGTPFRTEGQGGGEKFVETGGELGPSIPQPGKLALLEKGRMSRPGVPSPGKLPHEPLPEEKTHLEHVARRAGLLPAKGFRREARQGSHHAAGAGQGVEIRPADETGHAEVQDPPRARGAHEDVPRCQIAVDDAQTMGFLHPLADVEEDPEQLRVGEPPLPEDRRQAPSLHVLHDDADAVVLLVEVVDGHHRGMAKLGQDGGLPAKAGHHGLEISPRRPEDLHRHRAIEQGVSGLPDLAHATGPQGLQIGVAPGNGPGAESGGVEIHLRHGWSLPQEALPEGETRPNMKAF